MMDDLEFERSDTRMTPDGVLFVRKSLLERVERDLAKAERELAELRELTQGVCRWTLTDYDHGWWTGECGAEWIFKASDPNGNKMKFCPDCGRKLEQVEPEPPESA